jgi:cytidylate kinase
VNFEEVLHNVQERDYIDSHREDSPLIKAEDAIEIDNSTLTLDQQFQKILQLVESKLENCK